MGPDLAEPDGAEKIGKIDFAESELFVIFAECFTGVMTQPVYLC